MNIVGLCFWIVCYTLCGIGLVVSLRTVSETEAGKRPVNGPRYRPFLGIYMVIATILYLAANLLLQIYDFAHYVPLFVFVCIYDCVLLIVLKPLRKCVSANTCGWLWILPIPAMYGFMRIGDVVLRPRWVVSLPIVFSANVREALQSIWLLVALLILLCNVISHYRFKRMLLKYAWCVEDECVLGVWHREQTFANFPQGVLKLYISPYAKTPLSIGIIPEKTYVILPEKEYTSEELSLIFRHELIHIGRKDSVNKFFMLFITALFWFNPLMWIAMRCSADDLELSCDETVLLGYDQQTRHRYAELLLNTAADQRGFTTCLSASARALRYRLKNAIISRKRWQGGILVGVLFIVLGVCVLFGDFSYNPGTAAERIFLDQDPKAYSYTDGLTYEGESYTDYRNADTEVLMKYLFELPVAELMRHYDDMGLGKGAQIIVETQEDKYVLYLSDWYLRVRTFPDGEEVETCYALRQSVDWQYLTSVLIKESE